MQRSFLFFYFIKSIFFLSSIFILPVNADTKIIAKPGDTLFNLAEQYGVPLKELMHKNNFNDANRTLKGEVILIPISNNKKKINDKDNDLINYKVVKGDTLYGISRDYKVDLKDIIDINDLDTSSILKPGQIILLPKGSIEKKVINEKDIKLATKKVFYHITSKGEVLSDIAKTHKITKEEIMTLNKLNSQIIIKPNTKLKIRKNTSLKWLKYGSLMLKWSEWSYLGGNYITEAKNKNSRSFYLAIDCKKRALNNTLKDSYWTQWYFPKSNFEFNLIDDFCDESFKI